jgi:hypothetical protein
MQGDYSANRGARPRLLCRSEASACGDEPSARLFLCELCRRQSLICRFCDRGQIYCSPECGQRARRRNRRDASRRYQSSRQGRLMHAKRTALWRANQRTRRCCVSAARRNLQEPRKNVTHQGSPPPLANDLLAVSPTEAATGASTFADQARRKALHCHWCGRHCPVLVRQGFLRRRARRQAPHWRRPKHGDTS